MSFDRNEVEPKVNPWYSTNVEYQGKGFAKFLDPEGIVEGNATIRFNEFGESNIELTIEKYSSTLPLQFGLHQLLEKGKPVKTQSGWAMGIGDDLNPCIEFKLETEQGVFHAGGNNGNQITSSDIFLGEIGEKLIFNIYNSEFQTSNTNEPKYWVLPLSNFISTFRQSNPYCDKHPLRIYPTPSIPDNLAEEDKSNAIWVANSKNNLIYFTLGKNANFIERLPDYANRIERLIAGKEREIITALMVGEIDIDSEIDNWEEWGGFDFLLLLLGLASGSEVGAPWIEFRDANGNLVRRVHKKLGHSPFSKGHQVIDERFHSGVGYFISKSYLSPAYNSSFLRVVIKNLIRGGLNSNSVEMKMRYLSVALDNLCDEYKVKKPLVPGKKYKKDIATILKSAQKDIDKLARQAESQKDSLDAFVLRKISAQVSSAKTIATGFGENVASLVGIFNMPDIEIMEKFYEANPRSDKRKKWQDVISFYRGISMHKYFTSDRDFEDAIKVLYHLQDILVRIVFRILEYDGTYQPPMKSKNNYSVDWVKPETPARKLGY